MPVKISWYIKTSETKAKSTRRSCPVAAQQPVPPNLSLMSSLKLGAERVLTVTYDEGSLSRVVWGKDTRGHRPLRGPYGGPQESPCSGEGHRQVRQP